MKRILSIMVFLLSMTVQAVAAPPFNDGVTLYTQGKYNEAIEVFEKTLADDPNDVAAHYYEALCYHCTGRLPAAFREYTWVSKHASDPEMLRRSKFGLTALARAGVISSHGLADSQAPQGQQQMAESSYPPLAPTYAGRGNPSAPTAASAPYQYRSGNSYGGSGYGTPSYTGSAYPSGAYPTYGGPNYAAGYGAQPYAGAGSPPQAYGGVNYAGRPVYPGAPTAYQQAPTGTYPSFQSGGQLANTATGDNGLPLIPPPAAARQPTGPAPRVIDMYTDWCGWCKVFEPFFLQAQAKYGSLINFQRANAESPENRDLVKKYKVRGFPTLLYFNADGKLIKRAQGAPQSLQAFEDDLFSVFPELHR